MNDDDVERPSLSRRLFLQRGSLAVAAAGVASTIPGLTSALTTAESEAPATESVVADEATATMTEPLVAHVRDLASGEIGLYSGTREVVFHDPTLANRLFNATR
jgi:hypothetical protein